MNAIAQIHKAKNFSDWCRAAYYASQITVTGKPDDFQIHIDDSTLDAAFQFLVSIRPPGYLAKADFVDDVLGNGTEQQHTCIITDVLDGKIQIETYRRSYALRLIETYERDHLARLEFPKVTVEEDYSDRVNLAAQRFGGEA